MVSPARAAIITATDFIVLVDLGGLVCQMSWGFVLARSVDPGPSEESTRLFIYPPEARDRSYLG